MVTYYKKDIGLMPLDLPYDLDCPCHILQGREITLAGIYGEYTRYNPDGSSWQPSPKERMRNLINTIRYINGVSKRILIIFGDFNFDWKNNNSSEMKFYIKTIQTLGLSQMINQITHPNPNGNGTIIDHILQRNATGNFFVQPMGIGDHFSVNYCNGNKKRIDNQPLIEVKIKVFDEYSLVFAKEKYPFSDETDYTDIEKISGIWEKWMLSVAEFATKSIWVKEFQAKWWKPWLYPLREAHFHDPLDPIAHKAYKDGLKLAHQQYDTACKLKKGHAFRDNKRITMKELKVDNVVYKRGSEMAQCQGEFWHKKIEKIIQSSDPDYDDLVEKFLEYNIERGIQPWGIREPSYEEFKDLISSLPNKNSCGEDGLPYTLLKHVREYATWPLYMIIREMIKQRKVCKKWIHVIMSAIYKKGSPSDPKNYRPIALGHLILRILEKWMSHCVIEEILKQNILPSNIHGFMPGKSTVTCIEDMSGYIEEQRTNGFDVCVLLMDATAAFDATPRNLMIENLRAMRCNKETLELHKAYLQDGWEMTVKINGECSERFPITTGVVQGGGHSATLYGATTALLEFALRDLGKLFLYADDSALVLVFEKGLTLEEKNKRINEAIKRIILVFKKLGLTINEIKSEILPMYSLEIDDKYMVKDFECKPTKFIKFLGMMVQDNLKPKAHLDFLERELNKLQHVFYRNCYNRNSKERVALYHAYIMSRVLYGSRIYLPNTTLAQRNSLQSQLDKILKKGFRKKTKGEDTPNSTKFRASLGIKSIEAIKDEMLIHQTFNLRDKFLEEMTLTQKFHSTRFNAKNLILQMDGNNFQRKIWNAHSLSTLATTKNPKSSLKRWLKNISSLLLSLEAVTGQLCQPPGLYINCEIPYIWQFIVIYCRFPYLRHILESSTVIQEVWLPQQGLL